MRKLIREILAVEIMLAAVAGVPGDASAQAIWTEQQKLTAIDAEPLDNFGSGVSVSGDTAIVPIAQNFQRESDSTESPSTCPSSDSDSQELLATTYTE